jgi:hypothetical protein
MARGKKAGPPVMDYDQPSVVDQAQAAGENPEFHEAPQPREPRERTTREPIKRMSLNLNEDGSIAWDRLRESNREEVKKTVAGWMNDPKMLAALGVDRSQVVKVFDESWCDTIYDTIGNVEVMMAPKMFGVTLEQAQILRYSEAEKNQLREPTARVINKYLPGWLVKFEDEIKLAMLLISISFVKVQMLRAVAAMNSSAKAAAPNGKEHPAPGDPNFMQEPAAA